MNDKTDIVETKVIETPVSNVDNIVSELISDRPAINDEAIEGESNRAKEIIDKNAHLIDKNNQPFDPEQHVTDNNGEPLLTAAGKLRIKSGRKKSTGGNANTSTVGRASTQKSSQFKTQEEKTISQIATGKTAADLLFTVGMLIGGEEWQPIKNVQYGVDERLTMESAFTDFFTAQDIQDLPAGWALFACVGMYALPRFRMTKTKSRFALARAWLSNKFSKKNKGGKNGSHINTRDDGKRQDNTSKENVPPIKK